MTVDTATRRIVEVGSFESPAALDSMPATEFHAGVLTAGLVNAHCHLELSHLKGAIGESEGLTAFISQVGKSGNGISDESRMVAVEAADRAMWEQGIEAVGDVANTSFSSSVKRRSPIRYRTFAEVCGIRRNNLEAARAVAAEPDSSLTPHSTYSLPDALFRQVCAESEAPLSIHFLESDDESRLFFGSGAMHEWYTKMGFECDFLHYGMPVERVVECVSADRSVLLVHCCYASPIDIAIIENHFTAPVYWVLCPRSNRYISDIAPRSVELLRKAGVKICIGTDSLSSNWSLSMAEELKCFDGVPLHELLGWVTVGGAAALGMDDTLGEVAEGRTCGLTLWSGIDLELLQLTPDTTTRRIL